MRPCLMESGRYREGLIFFPGCFNVHRVFIAVLPKGRAQERWGEESS